mmetsp:Transcript_3055/g.7646  ORF Transcript_3055/g.7646 Transcript_3055/m.7646 type:complete len:201 (-) Transcript_3055:181-783(-)
MLAGRPHSGHIRYPQLVPAAGRTAAAWAVIRPTVTLAATAASTQAYDSLHTEPRLVSTTTSFTGKVRGRCREEATSCCTAASSALLLNWPSERCGMNCVIPRDGSSLRSLYWGTALYITSCSATSSGLAGSSHRVKERAECWKCPSCDRLTVNGCTAARAACRAVQALSSAELPAGAKGYSRLTCGGHLTKLLSCLQRTS